MMPSVPWPDDRSESSRCPAAHDGAPPVTADVPVAAVLHGRPDEVRRSRAQPRPTAMGITYLAAPALHAGDGLFMHLPREAASTFARGEIPATERIHPTAWREIVNDSSRCGAFFPDPTGLRATAPRRDHTGENSEVRKIGEARDAHGGGGTRRAAPGFTVKACPGGSSRVTGSPRR
jgi:hypothetical protein